jgi:hypothetical protein
VLARNAPATEPSSRGRSRKPLRAHTHRFQALVRPLERTKIVDQAHVVFGHPHRQTTIWSIQDGQDALLPRCCRRRTNASFFHPLRGSGSRARAPALAGMMLLPFGASAADAKTDPRPPCGSAPWPSYSRWARGRTCRSGAMANGPRLGPRQRATGFDVLMALRKLPPASSTCSPGSAPYRRSQGYGIGRERQSLATLVTQASTLSGPDPERRRADSVRADLILHHAHTSWDLLDRTCCRDRDQAGACRSSGCYIPRAGWHPLTFRERTSGTRAAVLPGRPWRDRWP